MSTQSKFIVLALLGAAIVLSYSIYLETINPDEISQTNLSDGYPSWLSALEIQAINPPLDGSFEEKEEHLEVAQKVAKEKENLAIKECFGDPAVFKTKLGQEFIIVNLDSKEHIIAFNKDNIYTIPARGEITVTAGFGFGSGIYGYSCDGSEKPTGMVLVDL